MMANLFSSFDPSTICSLSLNWLSSVFTLILTPILYWMIPSRWMSTWLILILWIHKEFKVLIKNQKYLGSTLFFSSLLIFIMINNFMGLFPYLFTCSSHLNFSLYLSIPLWLSFMIFGWICNTSHMLAHLVPQGAPKPLLPFLVIIETISNMIRPGTLAIRLTANMIAGHLLITLLSSSGNFLSLLMLNFLVLTQIMLLVLESAVALIQSYVFSILVTLYSSETN
uniref:ATP synthase subunit a n=1 Tax=Trigonopterus kotamobagensis TaxID=2583401 RepID=A0A7H1KI22_9CUCU|nr:ATP synthase F0 subunit 6 [Trigonopterus kotamobagensis]QNT26938.1 ATP synthase F0 subunit 6 [Trigonopterus kotamobagensis]